MRFLRRLTILAAAGYALKWLYEKYVVPAQRPMEPTSAMRPSGGTAGPGLTAAGDGRVGYDTPTGTDPAAKYREPGYQDKSFGQAVAEDQERVDGLLREHGGDADEAAITFRNVSSGAPALERQEREHD